MSTTRSSLSSAVMFVLLALTWGSSFLFIKIGLGGLSSEQVAVGRVLLGAATLAAVMLVTRRQWPRARTVWVHLLVVAVFLNVVPFLLVAWAEQTVASSVASIYNATTPIMALLATRVMAPEQRLRRGQVLGLAIGLAGVVVLVGPWQLVAGARGSAAGQLALLGMTACYGFGLTYLRRHLASAGLDPVTTAATQVALAAAVMLAIAPAVARGAVHPTPRLVAAMLALGCLGTGAAYVWNTHLVQTWGATRAATVTYLTPVVGVLLGVAVLGEQLTWTAPVGGAVVLAGIAISARTPAPRPSVTAPEYEI